MQLCKSCKSHLPEGAKFCSVCGQAVPAARIPDNSSFASPPSRYTTVKESTSTYKSPVTPLPLTPEDGKILPPISYTTVSPLSGYTTSSPPDYPGSSQSSASNRDTPLPSLYPFDNPYIDSLASANQSDATVPPQLPPKIPPRPRRGWMRWLLVALVCLLVGSGVVGAFQVLHRPVSNSQRGTPTPQRPSLDVQPSVLDFGSVPKGTKVILAALLANTGDNELRWSANVVQGQANAGSTGWLSLDNANSGKAPPDHTQQLIYSAVDTSSLAIGAFNAGVEEIASNAGIADIHVRVHVISPTTKRQAQLNVNPSFLNLGRLLVNQQTSALLTIGNTGTAQLTWNASAGNAHWLTLDRTSGIVGAGDRPQALKVTANTTHLLPGSYSTLINITSNGGNKGGKFQVGVTLVVSASKPVNNGVSLNVSPSNFMSGCLSCVVTLSSPPNTQGNVNWKASSMGLNGVRFTPASGTLASGRSIQVTVSVPNATCPASAVFSFSGAANTASVLWSCVPTVTPTPTLTANVSSFSNGCLSCVVTLSPSAGSQVNLNWKVASTGISGVSFKPSSGMLKPGQVMQVTVNMPQQNCPASTTFDFVGPGNTVSVIWSCSATPSSTASPTATTTSSLTVSPSSLDASNCSANSDGTYTCTISVGETGQGNLSWSASSSVGGTLSPASGQLSAGQTQQSVTISSIPCQSGSFTFTGQNSNSVTVAWSCTAVAPVLTISPNNLDASSNCSYTDGSGFSCNVALSTNSDATSNLTWSVASGGSSATFTPSSGTLTPGQSATVNLLIPDSASLCPFTNSISITDQNGNSYSISFTCGAPSVSVQPQTMSNSSCTQNSDGSWTCLVTISLGQYNFGSLHWTATAGGGNISGVAFSPSSGDLTSNQSTTVTVTIPATSCPASTVFSFSYNQTSSSVDWSC